MDNAELKDAVSFLIDGLLACDFSPERLANVLRRGLADSETREQLSSTEPLEFDLGSEQASNAEGTAAGRRGEGELIEKF